MLICVFIYILYIYIYIYLYICNPRGVSGASKAAMCITSALGTLRLEVNSTE